MAYALLKDEASATDRMLWLGHRERDQVEQLDISLGFIHGEVDDDEVATAEELAQFVEYWNAKMR